MAQGIIDLEKELKNYIASTPSSTSLSSDASSTLQSLRCPVCLMKFKDPRRLECEHTFCKECLQAVLKRQNDEGAQQCCLICQEEVVLNQRGVDSLDTVVYVQNIHEVYDNTQNKDIKCSKCNGRYCSLCIRVACKKCNKYTSNVYCNNCNLCLCLKCSNIHFHQGHTVVDIELVHQSLRSPQDGNDNIILEADDMSATSSKDSNEEFAVYTVTNDSIDVENAWEEKSDTSKYSNGEIAQSYNVTENNDDSTSEDGGDTAVQSYSIAHDEESIHVPSQDAISNEVVQEERDTDSMQEQSQINESHNEDVDMDNLGYVNEIHFMRDQEGLINREEETNTSNDPSVEDGGGQSRETDQRLTIIDDIELSNIVNETIETEIRHIRLRPSLPQNMKRQGSSCKRCSRITVGFVILLVICILAYGSLALSALLISPRGINTYVYEKENVLLTKVDTFWVSDLSITSAGPFAPSYHFETEFYLMDCNQLQSTRTSYSFTTSGTQPISTADITVDVHLSRDGRFIYLLGGSSIVFNVLITSDTTYKTCISELNIYENYEDFITENGLRAIQTNCIDIHKDDTVSFVPTTVRFEATKESFYFATLSVPPSASYSINVTTDKLYYNFTNEIHYKDNCSISFTSTAQSYECNFSLLTTSIVTSLESLCILATTAPYPPVTDPSFIKIELTSIPNVYRNIAYVVIPGVLVIYLTACLLFWVIYKCCIICYFKLKAQTQQEYITML